MRSKNGLIFPTVAAAPTRRQFLHGAGALAGAAALGPMLGTGRALAQDTPVKGGTIRFGLAGGNSTDSLDPRSYTDTVMINVGHAVFNGLVEWGEDGLPKPQLASSWEPRGSAAEWVLTLRDDVEFSNGKKFTADDAIYSLNMHRGETTSGAAGPMKAITDVRKLSDNQIQISLDSPDGDFMFVLTDYHVLMVPDGHTDFTNPIGTGGYTVGEFNPGVRIVLNRRDGYWKPDRAHVDTAEITVIIDESARLNALLSGQVDLIHRVDPKAVPLLTDSGQFNVLRTPSGWHAVLAMQVNQAPFDNLDVRLALKHAINRQQVLDTFFNGFGSLGNDHPIPPGDPYFNTELAQIPYDLDKAKFHWQKAGLGDASLLLQASDAAFNGAVDMATLFQESARQADIPLEIKAEPADGFWDNVWLKGAFVQSYWGGRPAATQMLGVAYKAGAPWNETRWDDAEFETLLSSARAETDEAKRKQHIWDMQRILSERGGAVIPVFRDWVQALSPNIGGFVPTSGFDLSNGYSVEKVWLKA